MGGKKTKLPAMTALTEIGFKTTNKKKEDCGNRVFLLRLEVDAGRLGGFYSSWLSLKKVEASPRQIGQVRFV